MKTKTETVAIRVTPEEKERLKALAAADDVTVSKYLYRLVFKREDSVLDTLMKYYNDFDFVTAMADDEYIELCQMIIAEVQAEIDSVKEAAQ